jgi:hypothetical protein
VFVFPIVSIVTTHDAGKFWMIIFAEAEREGGDRDAKERAERQCEAGRLPSRSLLYGCIYSRRARRVQESFLGQWAGFCRMTWRWMRRSLYSRAALSSVTRQPVLVVVYAYPLFALTRPILPKSGQNQ